MNHNMRAEHGWLMVGTVVGAYECIANKGELLSQGVDRALERHPIITAAAIGYIALHLLNALPEQIDPLHQLAIRMGHETPQ